MKDVHRPHPGRGGRAAAGGALLVLLWSVTSLPLLAQVPPPPRGRPAGARPEVLDQVGIDQKLDAQVPLDLAFRDEAGRAVRLGDYFGDKPVVLSLVYYDCPMLCTQVISGLVSTLRGLSFTPGEEFVSVTVSFDPREQPALAAAKKQSYIQRLGRPEAAAGWHFLTGDEAAIKALTGAVGFRYAWDKSLEQFAHASGIMVLTPQGKISRYFYGVDYAPRDLRLGLVEASAGRVGSLADQVLLLCYHYDPTTGKYGVIVMNVLRLAGALTVAALFALMIYSWRRNKARQGGGKVGYSHPGLAPLLFYPVPFAPEQASSFAGEVDALYLALVGLTAVVSLSIAGLELYFAIKYRRRRADEVPPEIEGSRALEVIWIVVPLVVFLGIFLWSASIYFRLYRPPKEALEIFVTGKQWMWRVQHPDGQREINALHLPVGRRIKLTMTSEDVIHSFFIPAFRTKNDVVPGRYTTTWFEPIKTGSYHLFCTEYCGTQHSGMIGTVTVMEPSDYQAWLSGGASTGSPAAAGQKLFASLACNTCHRGPGGQTGRGPAIEGLFGKEVRLTSGAAVTADEAYIRESVLDPRAKVVAGYEPIMPTFQGQVSEEQILQLIAYIKSVGPQGQVTDGAGAGATQGPGPASARPAQEGGSGQSGTRSN